MFGKVSAFQLPDSDAEQSDFKPHLLKVAEAIWIQRELRRGSGGYFWITGIKYYIGVDFRGDSVVVWLGVAGGVSAGIGCLVWVDGLVGFRVGAGDQCGADDTDQGQQTGCELAYLRCHGELLWALTCWGLQEWVG